MFLMPCLGPMSVAVYQDNMGAIDSAKKPLSSSTASTLVCGTVFSGRCLPVETSQSSIFSRNINMRIFFPCSSGYLIIKIKHAVFILRHAAKAGTFVLTSARVCCCHSVLSSSLSFEPKHCRGLFLTAVSGANTTTVAPYPIQ